MKPATVKSMVTLPAWLYIGHILARQLRMFSANIFLGFRSYCLPSAYFTWEQYDRAPLNLSLNKSNWVKAGERDRYARPFHTFLFVFESHIYAYIYYVHILLWTLVTLFLLMCTYPRPLWQETDIFRLLTTVLPVLYVQYICRHPTSSTWQDTYVWSCLYCLLLLCLPISLYTQKHMHTRPFADRSSRDHSISISYGYTNSVRRALIQLLCHSIAMAVTTFPVLT